MQLSIVSPILGFENIKKATIKKIDDFFYELDCDDITFTLIDPNTIREYDFTIPKSYKELLEIQTQEDIKVYNIVTILNPIKESTINFLAPILVNEKKGLLAQIALDEKKNSQYKLKESIKNFL